MASSSSTTDSSAVQPSRRAVLQGIAASGIAGGSVSTALAAAGHPDAELLALLPVVEKCFADQENANRLVGHGPLAGKAGDDYMDAVVDAFADVLERIMDITPQTMDGVRVKCRAAQLWHFHTIEEEQPEYISDVIALFLPLEILAVLNLSTGSGQL